jgi:hypothetical protein
MRRLLLTVILVGNACGGGSSGDDGGGGSPDAGVDATVEWEWPNAESSASSDPWIPEHHAQIRTLRPRVLALNFVNAKTNEEMTADVERIMGVIAEASRWHGYDDDTAPAMVQLELARAVDLRDVPPPPGWPWNNSTLYPRDEPREGQWGFDYAALFTPQFAAYYGYTDPTDGHALDLCELVNNGTVHEVWIYVDGDIAGEAGLAEIIEMKPRYDADRRRIPGEMDYCAGNGCWDEDDIRLLPAHCTRTLRIASINHTRGPGCFMENISHGFEWTGNGGVIPYLNEYFPAFGDFNLDERYGVPFESWYACPYGGPTCITYTAPQSLTYDVGFATGTIDNYLPACGQAHVPPNGRGQYDYGGESPAVALSTCKHFRQLDGPGGVDDAELFQSSDFTIYNDLAPDCGGGWHVWWMQNFPGYHNRALAYDGSQMLPWWPFVYY